MSELKEVVKYLDWNGSIDILYRASQLKLFALIIGPKGTGKTSLVRKFAEETGKKVFL
jgi:nitric oxide reductase NorQ protein